MSPYKTKSVFNFENEYGVDPVMLRYGADRDTIRASEMNFRLAESDRLNAEADLAMAQAEEEAKLAPLKKLSERFRIMTDLSDQRTKLEDNARTQTEVVQANERLKSARSIDDLATIDVDFPNAQMNPAFQRNYSSKLSGFRNSALGQYAQSLNAAKTEDEIAAAKASLHVLFLADDAFNRNVSNLDNAASARVKALRSAQAASVISRATGTQETLDARMQYADVLNDPKVQAASEMAGRQSSAMRGLTQLGAETMPVTQDLRFDIDRAENIVETLGQTDIRTLSAAQRGIQKQLEDPMLDPDGPEAKALQSDLTNINRQIAGITNRSNQQTTRAAMDLQSLGGTNPDWIDTLIDGGGGAPATPSATAPTAPEPAPGPAPATPSPSPEAEPEKKEKQKPYDPKDRAELARLELEVQRAREEAGLADQPAGIRQINEALAAQNAPVREKVAQLEAAQERINPFAEADAKDAQTIQAALDLVYPEMQGGGFDVGSAEDPRVVSAAEFLSKVSPSLLRMVASAPGSNRAGLSLEEISNIAAKATRSARGRKQK